MTNAARNFWNSTIVLSVISAAIAGGAREHEASPSPPAAAVVYQSAPVDSGAGCDCEDGPLTVVEPDISSELPAQDSKVVAQAPGAIAWQPNLPDAVKLSRETGKLLWIHVVHDGCGPCEKLKPFFRDARFVEYANGRLVAVQVDRFKGAGPAVVNVFNAGGSDPVDVFVFPDTGKSLRYPNASPTVESYLNRLASVPGFKGQAEWTGYVVSAKPGKWKLKGETIDVSHLMTHANHAGKFPEAWLRSLSRNELLTLHDHDHDDNVRWEFVPALEGKP